MIQLLSKEESLENCIRLIHGQSNLPAFSHLMAEVAQAMSDENTTLNLLTNLVLKNVSLTTMVLRVANSIHYNPRGKPILSVSRAITMIGWDSIGNLASGVLVFEHFGAQSEKLKELVLFMMLTGNHARQIAIRSGLRGVEEAYLCGMFRNLGELIVACYLPAEYARILDAMRQGQNELEACEAVLQVRYADLGKAMAHYWNLPEAIAICMENPDLPAAPAQTDLDRLQIVSSFSQALSTAVYRKDRSESRNALQALLKRYGSAIPVKEGEIPAILEAAVSETEDTFQALRIPMNHASLSKQIAAATGAEIVEDDEPSPQREDAPGPAPDGWDILNNFTKELGVMLDSADDFDLNASIMMILEAFYRGAGLDRALFCLVNSDRTHVQARLGVGAGVEPLLGKFRFPIVIPSGPIASALLAKQDLFVDGEASARYSRSAFAHIVGAPCFGILPLTVDGVVAGCLYFDSASDSFTFDARKKRALLELRNFAVLAVARARSPSH